MSFEYRAFTTKRPELVCVLQHSLEELSDRCLAKSLISEETYHRILELNSTDSTKTRLMLSNIASNINHNSKHFEEFVSILEQEGEEIAQTLREELKELQKEGQLQESDSNGGIMASQLQESDSNEPTHLTSLEEVSFASKQVKNELIYTPYQSGVEVVDQCLKKLNSPVFDMPEDNKFMRRIALVMSEFGRVMKNPGGIWQLSLTAFEDTMDTRAHSNLPRKYEQIWDAFKIDWRSVKYDDLKKPFYSALAARLYLSNFPQYIPAANDLDQQAKYWKFKYMRGEGDMEKFLDKVQQLE